MKITLTETMFIQQFIDMGRKDNFSYDALRELFNYYEEMEEDTGEEMECDVITIFCYWSEESVEDIIENYSLQDLINEDMDEDEIQELVNDHLNDETYSMIVGDKILYQNF